MIKGDQIKAYFSRIDCPCFKNYADLTARLIYPKGQEEAIYTGNTKTGGDIKGKLGVEYTSVINNGCTCWCRTYSMRD